MTLDEVSDKPSGTEGLAKTKEELINKLKNAKPSLSWEHEGKIIQLLHEDGCRVSLGKIFYRHGDNFVIGEVFYAHAKVQNVEDIEGEPYETIMPIIAYAIYRDGVLSERDVKPYVMAKKLMLNDRPVIVEAKTRLAGTLETLMSLDAALAFKNGCEIPSWVEVYSEVKKGLKRFCNLDWDIRLYDVVSCWDVATYFQEIFGALPFLYPYGPTGTGKTRLLKAAVYTARHGFLVTDPSEATLFRTSEALKPSLGVDEGLIGSAAWKLIRTAFKRGLYVPRVEETKRNEFVVGLFETFMPVAFSSTELPRELGGCDADEARSIFIFMQQMPDPSGRDPEAWDFKDLRDKLYLLRLGRANEVIQALKQLESSNLPFYGHEREVWLPLLTIAKLVGDEVYNNVLSYAVELYGVKAQQQNRNEKIIIRAMLKLFRAKYAEALRLNSEAYIENVEFTSSTLQEFIKEVLQEWGEYEEHLFLKQWDNRVIGRLLTRLGIFKRAKVGKSHYIIAAKGLQSLFKRFFVGFVGFVGLKTKVVNSKNNPTTQQDMSERSQNQTSLDVFADCVGLGSGKIALEINPTNPTNPTRKNLEHASIRMSEANVRLESSPTLSKINPTNPTNPTIDGLAVAALHRLTSSLFLTEKCFLCGKLKVDFQANLTDGSWRLLCFDCGYALLRQLEEAEP